MKYMKCIKITVFQSPRTAGGWKRWFWFNYVSGADEADENIRTLSVNRRFGVTRFTYHNSQNEKLDLVKARIFLKLRKYYDRKDKKPDGKDSHERA